MENTGENLQGRSTSQITEIICSVVLLICLFLPWFTIYRVSVSVFDLINLGARVGRSLPFGPSASGEASPLFALFVYFHLVLYIINAIVQYLKRIPWLSFYTAWVPATVGFLLLFKTTVGGSDEYFGGGFLGVSLGVGAVISLLAALLMQFSAWTTIGVHHKKHRKYFLTALVWCIAGWVCVIAGIAIAFSAGSSLFDFLPNSLLLGILFLLIWFLAMIGIGHTFWLIYGGIVMACSPADSSITSRPTRNLTQEKANEFLNQVRRRSDEELKTILQHKKDYNERLVRAAKIIMLERISTPDSSIPSGISDSAVTPPVEETPDDKYKAYWPSTSNPAPETGSAAMSEREKFQPSSVVKDDSFDAIRESWKTKAKEEDRKIAGVQSAETAAVPVAHSSKNGHIVLISILAGILLAVGGILTYFLWYVPYAKDKDAPRTYVVANNVFLRSSRMAGMESNILRKVPYGTEVITYNKLGDWAEVKVDGQEGVMAAPYLLDSLDFALLDRVWFDDDAKECVESSKCRLAILDYFKRNHLQSGQNAWQFCTKPADQKPNMFFYPRIYNQYSKYTDFVFIICDNITDNRVLVCYSFDDVTEKPIFRFSTGAPQTGFIKNIVNKYGNVRIIFDNNESVNLSL